MPRTPLVTQLKPQARDPDRLADWVRPVRALAILLWGLMAALMVNNCSNYGRRTFISSDIR